MFFHTTRIELLGFFYTVDTDDRGVIAERQFVGSLDSGNTAVKALTTSQVLQNSVLSGVIANTSERLVKKVVS